MSDFSTQPLASLTLGPNIASPGLAPTSDRAMACVRLDDRGDAFLDNIAIEVSSEDGWSLERCPGRTEAGERTNGGARPSAVTAVALACGAGKDRPFLHAAGYDCGRIILRSFPSLGASHGEANPSVFLAESVEHGPPACMTTARCGRCPY